eukprot:CAMPEP_0177278568 /NCGR_PEP_ID=MMETSP0367-20130122/69377_1 /TAXON_ID=447022 ORGANISM="Scrippsiella hangoei-like, Strain SHHI-4" /NCGR_SAMPLE_ID=MMETSP0367 /ASSEMBLY_ACC=CAM_ASM_000362 /LENGTH=49 /DNA_ID= /DNA_START= /DNA_END= /DNA_ORIENTATION=
MPDTTSLAAVKLSTSSRGDTAPWPPSTAPSAPVDPPLPAAEVVADSDGP